MMVTIQLDPVIVASLDRLTQRRGRAQLIRDALYSYVWDVRRNGGANVRSAPGSSKVLDAAGVRVVDGKLAPIDDWGLLL
jgi:metal-responsive CopG/Arc/MetJ family transcriptional regulator